MTSQSEPFLFQFLVLTPNTYVSSTSSGPILFTTTLDGVFRIWGCMIDEPNFFSLWATLDVHTTLPYHIPLATCFRRTRQLFPVKDGEERRKGTKDDFVTVFSDGSAWTTTVEVRVFIFERILGSNLTLTFLAPTEFRLPPSSLPRTVQLAPPPHRLRRRPTRQPPPHAPYPLHLLPDRALPPLPVLPWKPNPLRPLRPEPGRTTLQLRARVPRAAA